MKILVLMISLLALTQSLEIYAEPVEESEQIVIRLSTDVQLMPLYLSKIADENSNLSPIYIRKLEEILQFDLNHNGMTYTIAQDAQKEKLAESLTPEQANKAKEWQRFNVFYVIKTGINAEKNLSAVMLSVNGDSVKSVGGISLSGNLSQDRRQVHQLADAIHKSLFDKDGIATTHVLYTIKKKTDDKKWISEIWESDYDGENARPIIRDNGYNICPIYIPPKPGNKSGSFFYVSYRSSQPKIFMASLRDGNSTRFSYLRGNQLIPAISRQRDKVAFICDITGNPDLFVQPFNPEQGITGKAQQVFSTRKATQGSPTFSPDGERLAFVSNKDGSPKIYVMNIPEPGTSLKDVTAQLLTKHSKESSAPSWSPDGSKLAYCAMTNGSRQIWIYDFNSKEERQLTQGTGNKENPTWAPNSLNLIYNSSDANACDLYLININQPKAVKITSGSGEKRFPNWEPR